MNSKLAGTTMSKISVEGVVALKRAGLVYSFRLQENPSRFGLDVSNSILFSSSGESKPVWSRRFEQYTVLVFRRITRLLMVVVVEVMYAGCTFGREEDQSSSYTVIKCNVSFLALFLLYHEFLLLLIQTIDRIEYGLCACACVHVA